MATYSYKDVVYRSEFQALIPELEKEQQRECDNDPNYSGDYWCVAEMLLVQKDAEIAELKAKLAELEA